MGKHGNINSGIPTPDKNKIPIIPLGNDSYSIKKNPTDSSDNSFRTETISMHLKNHWYSYNQNIRNNILHLLVLNQVGF